MNRCLAGDVLMFVNTVADVAHSAAGRWHGSCNRNLGAAFVFIFRVCDDTQLAHILSLQAAARAKSKATKPLTANHRSLSSMALADFNDEDPMLSSFPLFGAIDLRINEMDNSYNDINEVADADDDGTGARLRSVPNIGIYATNALMSLIKMISEINRY